MFEKHLDKIGQLDDLFKCRYVMDIYNPNFEDLSQTLAKEKEKKAYVQQ
jgi:hypothetical protein